MLDPNAGSDHRLWVVVPAYNEERSVGETLAAMATQEDHDFTLLIVDNASTDATPQLVRDFAAAHPQMDIRVVLEVQKGTGAAADTGMRHAITAGATRLARTDADCLPASDWTRQINQAFDDGLELIAGRLLARTDQFKLRLWERYLLPGVVSLAASFGRIRPGNQDPEYLGPYMMCAGCNMAITADLYERCGGFPRTKIEELHEDRALVNRVRKVSLAYGYRKDVRVYDSLRRLRAYGLRNTLAWYADHRYTPEIVDIR